MNVGDLVKYDDEAIGVVTELNEDGVDGCYVVWFDGCRGWHSRSRLEILSQKVEKNT